MLYGIGLIEIGATDFERSRRFYRDVLGALEGKVLAPYRADFRLGPVTLVVTPLRAGWAPVANCVMATLITDALDKDLAALQARGAAVLRAPAQNEAGRLAEIADPDGYRIGIFQPAKSAAVPRFYSHEEFERKVNAIQRDLREAMTPTVKMDAYKPAAKAAAQKPAKKKSAAPAKKPASGAKKKR
jgi:predicted enzyme related to lactoylglutathione lyase